uniref:AlNc14C11G1381 protein n=1 Tax=Albugo laibachii Nc14 TaxID=890382 RepID=F0W302_9STRA|nr:AlNc14C11G1381 [Albugo laibachii Nc14]|eukprot:CCA15439.1 AlNc14C11G1381 [Albugo laibachii Nc14]
MSHLPDRRLGYVSPEYSAQCFSPLVLRSITSVLFNERNAFSVVLLLIHSTEGTLKARRPLAPDFFVDPVTSKRFAPASNKQFLEFFEYFPATVALTLYNSPAQDAEWRQSTYMHMLLECKMALIESFCWGPHDAACSPNNSRNTPPFLYSHGHAHYTPSSLSDTSSKCLTPLNALQEHVNRKTLSERLMSSSK